MTTLIETMRVAHGRVPLWSLHMARLRHSAAMLELEVPPLDPPVGGEDRVVRFAVSAGKVEISERPVGSIEPLRLITSPAPHRGYPHKVAQRSWLSAARNGIQPVGGDDALLLDPAGRVVEATKWAIGWWEGERLCFPPLELGGLPSVARSRLDEAARGGVHEVSLFREELAWRALFACNAACGVVPIAGLDGDDVPGNKRTQALADRFWDRVVA